MTAILLCYAKFFDDGQEGSGSAVTAALNERVVPGQSGSRSLARYRPGNIVKPGGRRRPGTCLPRILARTGGGVLPAAGDAYSI